MCYYMRLEIISQRDDVFKSYAKSFAGRMTQRDKRIRNVLLKSLTKNFDNTHCVIV